MKKIILSCFIVLLSLNLVSCNDAINNLLKNDSKENETSKPIKKDLEIYFITTSEEEQNKSNWVIGESNESPLEEKEETIKKDNIAVEDNTQNRPVENNAEEEPEVPSNTINPNTNTNTNVPDPNYNMNDIVPSPDDTTYNPIDSSANPDDIVSDPYSNDTESDEDEDDSSKMAEYRYLGNEPN